ncbi:AGE family epimerase/isomerase [Mucilaginibacter psychrotolerans]|uniref:Cellobiose 2-epimerase n=1 Tax=Mucilaginibacter psychrotolerans TaxID=1524096 RepID=A0A4Y8S4M9_9SPHI|nr:AGE family epimerase/isomerase [Mucilaginibacter psychrotolerans]TFF33427.1 N-acyl-D-glucosamine 2-epimerase [Mucilaginibacter psychrotolerans]
MNKVLADYKKELEQELENILTYWVDNTMDEEYGGFIGRIDNDNKVIPGSPKGSVLNARILWSFSAAYNKTKNALYLEMAAIAYRYVSTYFIDEEYGGVYWTVDHEGKPLDTKKQVYASAFTIYAFSEFYKATKDEEVLAEARKLYHLLVEKSYDTRHTGYLEAFTRDWQPIADLRLSAKDANEKKSMNTHLHVLEAYTTLYTVWPDEGLRIQIEVLLRNFIDYIIEAETKHLILFFDEEWNAKSDTVSYGHDIEATWLLLEAAEAIHHAELIEQIKFLCVQIAEAALEGLDKDGGLWYEYEPAQSHLVKEKHWWPQAEAMVGFYNTYQITGDEKWLQLSTRSWDFVKQHILDTKNGEWFWGIYADGRVMATEDKAGLWKCPYHNSRACLEVMRRLNRD